MAEPGGVLEALDFGTRSGNRCLYRACRLVEQRLDGRTQAERIRRWREAALRFAIAIDQELGPVPLDGAPEHVAQMRLEELEHGMRIWPVDVHLCEHVELCPVSIGKGSNFLCVTWFLLAELIAREGKDAKTPRVQVVVQLHELFVIARGQASLGCRVDDEANTAGVLRELHQLATQHVGAQLEER